MNNIEKLIEYQKKLREKNILQEERWKIAKECIQKKKELEKERDEKLDLTGIYFYKLLKEVEELEEEIVKLNF